MSTILLTGGLGFIGSHIIVELSQAGYQTIIFDNLHNSNLDILDSLHTLHCQNYHYIPGDICNPSDLRKLFSTYSIDAVIHLAALKSVAQSHAFPDLYHTVNVQGTLNLLNIMREYNCFQLIYSSSATVYGSSPSPVSETSPTGIGLQCPYAQNKYDVEQYLLKNCSAWSITILRYFNPIGAHSSGLLGENPQQPANNVFPHLLQVAKNNHTFTIYGDDYSTPDGTCIRDYIHVQDLAHAHFCALAKLKKEVKIYNVGTGKGTSVKQLVQTFNKIYEEESNKSIVWKIGPRRPGDLGISYANCTKIQEELGFQAHKTIEDMCRDGLRFAHLI